MRRGLTALGVAAAGCVLVVACGSDSPVGPTDAQGGAPWPAKTAGDSSHAGGDVIAGAGCPCGGTEGDGGEGRRDQFNGGVASDLALAGQGSAANQVAGAAGQGQAGAAGEPPEFHLDAPQVVDNHGGVLAHPKLIPVFFANESKSRRDSLIVFFEALPSSSYWSAVSEYGVGSGSIGTVAVLDAAPSTITDAEIQTLLADKIADASLPTTDSDSLYVLVFPRGTSVRVDNADVCSAVVATYHSETTKHVPYVVVPPCSAQAGLSPDDSDTLMLSPVVLAATTNPRSLSAPGWTGWDSVHYFWSSVFASDIKAQCAMDAPNRGTLVGLPNVVQRVWSNVAAARGHDPCVPVPAGLGAYFNTVPVLPDTANVLGNKAEAVKIAVGESRTIELKLFSDDPIPEAWTVAVVDSAELQGQAPRLSFSLDKPSGTAGETLKLTIHALTATPLGASFVITSTLGQVKHHWLGYVAN